MSFFSYDESFINEDVLYLNDVVQWRKYVAILTQR